ncbi:MAG TPA: protein kinase [Planctomycetota bacterium]
MTLAAGSSLAHYSILAPLGAGAMGEVYRARDTKLGREVAIKVLPEHFADDEERLRRFEREAKSIAALNHSNVAQIYGVDQVGDTCFLVLELVPGETLEQRLARGPLPLDEALEVCRQIAEGLEAAHEAGVIHRDLKPANVRLTPDGRAKVLDFGLAKPVHESREAATSTDSVLSTEAGRLLGTPTYMAPEQARGRPIDKRVDVWAFGCVLYECLTARRAFMGDSLSDVLAAVLKSEADLAVLPADLAPRVRELVVRCLEKDPRRRLRDIGEARLALERAQGEDPRPARRLAPRELAAWMLAAVAGGAALLAWSRAAPPAEAPPRPGYRFSLPPAGFTASLGVISPDGSHLVSIYSGHLWLRKLDEAEGRELAGTSGAGSPFWSPDGRQIGFFSAERLMCVGLDGAPPRVLAPVEEGGRSGTWSVDGTILVYHSTFEHETWFVLAPGQASLTLLRRTERTQGVDPDGTTPWFLPDGRHFLFTRPVDGVGQLQVGSLDSEEVRVLTPAGSMGQFAAPDQVLYVRDGVLYAQAFDPRTLSLGGPPRQLVDDVYFFASNGTALFSVSQQGTLVYRRRFAPARLQWVDRGGRELTRVLQPDLYVGSPALAPDGKRLAVPIADPSRGTTDLWLVDLERGIPSRLTSAKRSEGSPCWSPDGRRLAYSADKEGPPNVYLWELADSAGRVLVPYDRKIQSPTGWTPDGRFLFYGRSYGTSDVWLADLGAGTQREFLASEFSEQHARVSPDGRHVAFTSNESGRPEVYVVALDGARERTRVSVDGGSQPRWSADGTELFFELRGTALLSAQVAPDPAGGLRVGTPELLFRLPPDTLRGWDVARDGQRFLLVLVDPAEAVRPDEVIVDWPRLLSKGGS